MQIHIYIIIIINILTGSFTENFSSNFFFSCIALLRAACSAGVRIKSQIGRAHV